jgi:hypothetical protein
MQSFPEKHQFYIHDSNIVIHNNKISATVIVWIFLCESDNTTTELVGYPMILKQTMAVTKWTNV